MTVDEWTHLEVVLCLSLDHVGHPPESLLWVHQVGQETVENDWEAPIPDSDYNGGQHTDRRPIPDPLLPDLSHILFPGDLHPQGVVEAGGLARVHTELEEPILTSQHVTMSHQLHNSHLQCHALCGQHSHRTHPCRWDKTPYEPEDI